MLYLIGPDRLVKQWFINFWKMVWMTTVYIILIHDVFWKKVCRFCRFCHKHHLNSYMQWTLSLFCKGLKFLPNKGSDRWTHDWSPQIQHVLSIYLHVSLLQMNRNYFSLDLGLRVHRMSIITCNVRDVGNVWSCDPNQRGTQPRNRFWLWAKSAEAESLNTHYCTVSLITQDS